MSLTRKIVVGVKTETTQGTAVSLAATDYILTLGDVDVTPTADVIEDESFRATIGELEHVTGKRMYDIKFDTYNKWSGSPGVAYTPLGALFQAAATAPTIVAVTSVAYNPTSVIAAGFKGPGKSVTAEVYVDGPTTGHKLRAKGCLVVNAELSNEASKKGKWSFTLRGLWSEAPTDAAFPTKDYMATEPAILQSAVITSQTDAICIANLGFSIENELADIPCANAAFGLDGYMITKQKARLKFDPQILAVADHPFIQNYFDGTSMAFSAVWTIELGGGTPQKLTLPIARLQYLSMKPADRNGIRIMQAEGACRETKSTGDDAYSLTFASA